MNEEELRRKRIIEESQKRQMAGEPPRTLQLEQWERSDTVGEWPYLGDWTLTRWEW